MQTAIGMVRLSSTGEMSSVMPAITAVTAAVTVGIGRKRYSARNPQIMPLSEPSSDLCL